MDNSIDIPGDGIMFMHGNDNTGPVWGREKPGQAGHGVTAGVPSELGIVRKKSHRYDDSLATDTSLT